MTLREEKKRIRDRMDSIAKDKRDTAKTIKKLEKEFNHYLDVAGKILDKEEKRGLSNKDICKIEDLRNKILDLECEINTSKKKYNDILARLNKTGHMLDKISSWG